jgi:hypothetical protein
VRETSDKIEGSGPHDFEHGQEYATVGDTEIEGAKVDGLQALLLTMKMQLLHTLKKCSNTSGIT